MSLDIGHPDLGLLHEGLSHRPHSFLYLPALLSRFYMVGGKDGEEFLKDPRVLLCGGLPHIVVETVAHRVVHRIGDNLLVLGEQAEVFAEKMLPKTTGEFARPVWSAVHFARYELFIL